jgi:hypothetical protein
MKKTTTKTKATVCIVESLDFFDEDLHKEGEIIFRTLRLSKKTAHYTYLRSRAEFEVFLKEFGRSSHRYLHISCHGGTGAFWTTLEKIKSDDFATMIAPYMDKRRLFLSTCLAADSGFAKALLNKSGCLSVLGPEGEINFDDAAIFWTAFYHLMFKMNPDAMHRSNLIENVKQCAKLVGQKFWFFDRRGGKFTAELLG